MGHMKKTWIKSSLRKPEQGKKVLCFDKGDVDVRQRFKDCWAPIPYVDAECANCDQPEFWQEIDFPDGYFGYMKIIHENKLLTIDEFEKKHPELYEELIKDRLMKIFEKKAKK
jgi:hypothetical protein